MKEVITKTERIVIDDSGIVFCTVLEGVIFDLEDAKENIAVIRDLSNGKALPIYVDITQAKGVTKEARAYLATEEIAHVQRACALLVNSPLSRLMGNFFLGFNRTKFPIRLFTDADTAKVWLKQFVS